MHILDVALIVLAVVVVVVMAGILARQRQMLRTTGAVPMALQRGQRWLYGVARYDGEQMRFYRAIGVGTKPSRVLQRGQVEVTGRRAPTEADRGLLPDTAVIVMCRAGDEDFALAIGDTAFTGFVSWLESSAPL